MLCFGLLVMVCEVAAPAAPPVHCPPLAVYSREDQRQAAREVRALPAGSKVARLVADYGTLRARCRAVEGE